MSGAVLKQFSLEGKVIAITGGAGFLGVQHAYAVAEAGGIPVLLDIEPGRLKSVCERISEDYNVDASGFVCDVTVTSAIEESLRRIVEKYSRIDALVNNAANDPKVVQDGSIRNVSRFENMPLEIWNQDISVGLTGAFLCSQIFGAYMANQDGGVIVNIASDLSVIAPDQRLYSREDEPEDKRAVKPVTYSVVKTGLIGLTRYLSTYWAEKNIRVNAISPGGIYNEQGEEFVARLADRIPMARMAEKHEIQGALVYLLSDASSYVTGINLVVDGGRSVW